jgi:hypothetical protein
MTIPFSLYLASWEHLYLMPGGTPAGLPNQVFALDPWVIILFEKFYCDENGLKGEDNAARLLGWTNSKLFVRLVKEGILEPIPTGAHVGSRAREVRRAFSVLHELKPEEAASGNHLSVQEFFAWRTKLLDDFLDQHRLLLYDFDLIGSPNSFPTLLEDVTEKNLPLEVRTAPLTKSPHELPQRLKALFDDLQRFEAEPLKRLRTGVLDQLSYLGILQKRASEYAAIDVELRKGVDERLERFLEFRSRFGDSGGWEAVRKLFAADRRGALPEALDDLQRQVAAHLDKCYRPHPSDFRKGIVQFGKAVASLVDVIHAGRVAKEALEGLTKLKKPIGDFLHYVRRRIFK